MTPIGQEQEPATGTEGEPPSRPGRRFLTVAISALVIIATITLVVQFSAVDDSAPTDATLADDVRDSLIDDAVAKASGQVAEVYKQIVPSLVLVQVERDSTAATSGVDDEGADIGSGVVINADGSILTAFHVVENASRVEVTFADGTQSAATVASTNSAQDIAVLTAATPPEVIVPAVLGSAQGASIGDTVAAVGHPLGLVGSATAGVISGLNRTIEAETGAELEGVIQFDAAVNPGSSGGPLLNTRGETIGIVVALADPTDAGFFMGIGFAVPIGVAIGGGAGGDGPPQ